MTDETSQVSDQSEEQELPAPSFSEQGDSSPSVDADAIVSKLTPILEQLVERKVQSTKDKRLSKIEKALGGRLDLLAELEELGQDVPKEVRSELRLRELEERLTQQSTQPAPARDDGSSQQKAAVTDAIAELSKHGLDTNDAGFIQLLRGQYKNRAEFDLAVTRHVVAKLAPQKAASPADVVQAPATGGVAGKSVEALTSDYQKEMLAAKRGDKTAIRAIKDKYIRLGVQVDHVVFT